jgi:hypothetical protein
MNAGDLDGAGAGVRAVLKIHPSHREALDGHRPDLAAALTIEILGQAGREGRVRAERTGLAERAAAPRPRSPRGPPRAAHSDVRSGAKGAAAGARPPRARFPCDFARGPSSPLRRREGDQGAPSGMGRKVDHSRRGLSGLGVARRGRTLRQGIPLSGKSRRSRRRSSRPSRRRKAVAKPGKVRPQGAATREAAPDPAVAGRRRPAHDPRGPQARVRGEARSRRVVLSDDGPRGPDNIAAVDAFKGVQAEIVERDQGRRIDGSDPSCVQAGALRGRAADALPTSARDAARRVSSSSRRTPGTTTASTTSSEATPTEAVHCFEETLNLDPHDQQAQRLKSVREDLLGPREGQRLPAPSWTGSTSAPSTAK